jgi:hypothetical protein
MMLLQIVEHTPVWVWGLLAALLAFGYSQARERDISLTRATVLPLVMLALSLFGVTSAFGGRSVALAAWAIGVAAAVVLARRLMPVRGARWSDATRTLHVPGSWVPMVLIVGLFAIKYTVGVTLAMQPAMAQHAVFASLCGLAYGVFSGTFLARGLSLRATANAAAPAPQAA